MLPEPISVTLLVARVLDNLKIPYFIGGSLATAFHGVLRSTLDVDIVADLQLNQVEPFVEALEGSFYVDVEMIKEAIRRRGSFNLLHMDTMFKVDIFIMKQRPFDINQMQRKAIHQVGETPNENLYVTTVEDIILAKLEWYKAGGEVSERQWRDVLSVIKIQKNKIDFTDLQKWARSLGVEDLLARALLEIQAL